MTSVSNVPASRFSSVLAAASSLVFLVAGCVGSSPRGPGARPPATISTAPSRDIEPTAPPTTTPTSQASAATSVALPQGVTLLAAPGQALPVRVRWVQTLSLPEQIAVDGGVVYAVDYALWAFRLSTGTLLWETQDPSLNGLSADGGVEIGLTAQQHVRVWAPYNYDLTADRQTGELIKLRRRDVPTSHRGMTVFPAPPPGRFRVNAWNPARIVARWPDGRVAWRIVVAEPIVDNGPAIAVPGGLVLKTSSGHLVVLDYI